MPNAQRKETIRDVNPFAAPLAAAVTRLSDAEMKHMREYVKLSDNYKRYKKFFETFDFDLLTKFAAAYCFPKSMKLGGSFQKATGYTPKQIGSLRDRLKNTAAEIDRLNHVEFPGGATFPELLREFGDLETGPNDIEESIALAGCLERLPTYIREYAEALKHWPHPRYRKLYTERNWRTLPLVRLCLWVKAITGAMHYQEISNLFAAVTQFAEGVLKEPPDSERTSEPDSLRHNVENFRLRSPKVYERYEFLAKVAADRHKEENPKRNELARK